MGNILEQSNMCGLPDRDQVCRRCRIRSIILSKGDKELRNGHIRVIALHAFHGIHNVNHVDEFGSMSGNVRIRDPAVFEAIGIGGARITDVVILPMVLEREPAINTKMSEEKHDPFLVFIIVGDKMRVLAAYWLAGPMAPMLCPLWWYAFGPQYEGMDTGSDWAGPANKALDWNALPHIHVSTHFWISQHSAITMGATHLA
ncbi:hypothetical protein IW261DRAFT_1427335 [Armillaria novae-zelandiae]|uniref:Uncharacterized protein n=1 Tax=Armillaria novae-zelandiae TaxID=153914 RepID=A0AA39TN67_9AGAR|nr:hypothetical protein IW261DRAFT_1427335 [Armillaria novae-zelandiae]